jgi:hypothetical protein
VRLALALALVLAQAGCVVDVDYGATRFRCPDGVTCPQGQSCMANLCVPGGTLPDASVDARDSAPDAALPNLLSNPGLEVGNDPWTAFAATFRPTTMTPHSGLRSIVVCKDATGTLDLFTAYADIVNGPAVPMGAHFRASVWVRKSFDALETAPPSIKIVLREKGGSVMQRDHSGPEVTPLTTTWVQLVADTTVVDPGRTQLNFLIWPGDVADGTCFAFDDAVAERLP